MSMDVPTLLAVDAGRLDFQEALAWQHRLVEARVADQVGDALIVCEHDPVYTAGRHADLARTLLGDTGVPVVEVERGGDVTYHGPGQVVVYPILKLAHRKAARSHVDALVNACVATATSFGLPACADHRRPGVWVGNDKLAAVGVRVQRGVTSHGLAFNVACDLDEFTRGIVPCGLVDAGVCSLASLGVATSMEEVRDRLVSRLGECLDRAVRPVTPGELELATGVG